MANTLTPAANVATARPAHNTVSNAGGGHTQSTAKATAIPPASRAFASAPNAPHAVNIGGFTSHKALSLSVQGWFVVAVLGQLMFAVYVAALYGASAFQGDWAQWNSVFKRGHVPGEPLGNAAVMVHIFLAIVITVSGPLQLVPKVRALWPVFHRWNGRVYLLVAVVTSVAGFIMLINRGIVGGNMQYAGIAFNGVLIIAFAVQALRHALARDFATHRRWALRLFLAVSGVWFFRIGLMFWIVLNRGPAGFDPVTFQGPFLSFLAFANYLVPLAFLELYFHAKEKAGTAGRVAMTVTLALLMLGTAAGIGFATMLMWLPRM